MRGLLALLPLVLLVPALGVGLDPGAFNADTGSCEAKGLAFLLVCRSEAP